MSTTTQILFNSPALHSLKREQLVKLCKIHSIKASGKNVELIEKLKQHAQTLPKDSPLSIAARSEPASFVPCPPQDDQTDEEEVNSAVPQDGNTANRYTNPRPSEQWEVVMESIQELEESSSQGTLSSMRTLGSNNGGTGEFGTGSSKSTTVSSSIKALATSLGLRRTNTSKSDLASTTSTKSSHNSIFPTAAQSTSHDELGENSTPYSALPPASSPPQTDHFTFNPSRMSMNGLLGEADAPLPGHALRPGVPAPSDARLSLGLGLGVPSTPTRQSQPTTTIRLISNPLSNVNTSYGGENGTPQLKPFKTTFDLDLGSPAPSTGGFNKTAIWPPVSPGGDANMRGIYPTLTFADLPPTMPSPSLRPKASASTKMDTEADHDPPMPGSLTPTRAATSSGSGNGSEALAPPAEPFIFGSPLPKHRVSNHQFRIAAASVLEEMNKRLQEDGVQGVGLDIINNLHPGAHSQKDLDSREIEALPGNKRGDIKEKFEKRHEHEFKKMEGIDMVMKRKAERSPKKDSEPVVLGKKRKSSAVGRDDGGGRRVPGPITGRASGTRVISNGRRAKAIPGAFGDDDEDDEAEEENPRAEKRVRVDSDASGSSKVLSPEALKKKAEDEEEEMKFKEREREAIRRKLELNKARRRSSAVPGGLNGRRSGRVSVGRNVPLAKPKPSRFGFFSSAKSIVQSVWNRGKPPPTTATSIPKPVQPAKVEVTKEKQVAPGAPVQKASVAPARSTLATAKATRVPSLRVNNGKDKDTDSNKGTIASSSSRSRSPIPSFGVAPSTRSRLMSDAAGTRTSRNSSLSGTNPSTRNSSLAGTGISRTSSTNVSSIGTRLSSTRTSSSGNISSMGSRKALAGPVAAVKASNTGSSSSRLSTSSSRLFAPTASSLAKAHRASGAALKPVVEDQNSKNVTTNVQPKVTQPSTPDALTMITNSPTVANNTKLPGPFSPRPGGVFSRPLDLPSGIPTPVKKRTLPAAGSSNEGGEGANPVIRQRSLAGRKPRISRSKVIARLASQRAAGTSGTGSTIAPRPSNGGKTRSSLGTKAQRSSFTGGSSGNVLMSAKKRARQSEYARRRSRVEAGGGKMDVSDD